MQIFGQRNLQCGEIRIESELNRLIAELFCQFAAELNAIVFIDSDL